MKEPPEMNQCYAAFDVYKSQCLQRSETHSNCELIVFMYMNML